jgi:thioredoxin-like negative regulator of GroEL
LIDVDEHPEIADKYHVWSVPTTILDDGTKVHTLRGIDECQCSLNKQKK